ncbi:MAG: hypothetical protein ACR2HH_16055 [Chthoniobacterales bacterium]
MKLKQWHSTAPERLQSLALQEQQLTTEIDDFVARAARAEIPLERLRFAANKVYNEQANVVTAVEGTIAHLFSRLAEINCELWHEVDKGYEVASLPAEAKDGLIKQLAILNLQRNECIDEVDRSFRQLIATHLNESTPAPR